MPVASSRSTSGSSTTSDRTNPNLDFALTDTVRLIKQLRNEGRTVLVHWVAAVSPTPTVAALYGAHRQGISGEAAPREVTSALSGAYPNNDFRSALNRLGAMIVLPVTLGQRIYSYRPVHAAMVGSRRAGT